jgi:coniferyl-aldehyde dehydrogenase
VTDAATVADPPETVRGLDEIFASMRAAQTRAPTPEWRVRADRLRRLEALITRNRDAIARAVDADFGRRPAEETGLLEIFPTLSGLRHALRHGRRWMRAERHWASFWFLPARTEIRPQPRGVIGIVAPWNYPLYLAAAPLIDALAAGNRAMIKMPELTPRFSSLFSRLVADAFRSDEVVAVNGDAVVGRAFAALPFDHLLFTGSTAVGRDVMTAAAANLTPVTLELGGKSPALIGPGARFERAVERILVGKLLNAGQTCIAPDYALLPRGQETAFVETARAVVERLYPGLPSNPQYASIASDRHFERLRALRDEAAAAGATVHSLGSGDAPGTRAMTPALLTGVDARTAIMQQEIFGPLLPLVPYDTLDDALAYVAARPHPLALYLFDDDRATIDRVLSRTTAGGVTVNDTILHIAQHRLPFGGVGASGMGAYHGEAGFRTFSRMTPILQQARINAVSVLNPPYGRALKALLKTVLR